MDMIDKKILNNHNLTQGEYDLIRSLIGREPNLTELGIFSAMWSEHCSYKSSKLYLQKLPTKGKRVIQGPGENAGIIDIGGGRAIVFKIESHNHPSFLEPFQGAATGVGGILRDIFTMGARPIAIMDSLRFGPLSLARNKSIMDGVIAGISSYGNSMGVPTVGGEVYFQNSYSLNPLVNVFCLGIAAKDAIFYAKTGGAGNSVLYVGSKTGRDGIHGATMASAEFGKETEHKRPNVQVGDPFKEKLLLEACLEVMAKELIVGIQDMGAAGLTCSTSEMAAKSATGIEIDLDRVPQREEGMNPYEIMLSESQERMLIAAKPERVKEVQSVFAKWDLDAVEIGKVTEGGQLKVWFQGQVVVDIPVTAIVDLCPAYKRKYEEPAGPVPGAPQRGHPLPKDLGQALLKLLSWPTIADKEWVYRQYDHQVLTNTMILPGADAAVLRIKNTKQAVAMTLDGNSFYTNLHPKTGAVIAVAEACRNLACVGARPVGVTNCLNFGNPEKPEIMGQFKQVTEGIAEACSSFGIPVTGGNVSFYNDTEGVSILPTPVLGIVGLIKNYAKTVSPGFKKEGQAIVLLGENKEELGGSEYRRALYDEETGPPPAIDLKKEKAVQKLCLQAIDAGLLQSAHDISEGGLAVCLAECSFFSREKMGCRVDLRDALRPDDLLFGETQSRIVVSVQVSKLKKFLSLAAKKKVPAAVIGKTGGKNLRVSQRGKKLLNIPVGQAFQAWKNAIPVYFKIK